MSARNTEFLDRLTFDASTDLFAGQGVSLERRPASPLAATGDTTDGSCGGLISFSSPALSGSLLVVGSFTFLASCRPPQPARALAPSSSTDWILIRDWSMEIANQLLGRMRNRLYRYGMTLDAKAPTAVSGVPLAISIRARRSDPLQFLASGKHTLRVWLDVTLGSDFDAALDRGPVNPSGIPREGDVILF
jgi:hypothetical protein